MAIVIIAVGYSSGVAPLFLLAALITPAMFGAAIRRPRLASVGVVVPLAVVTWALVHEAGIHATIAGVLLAATVPTRKTNSTEPTPTTEALAHRLQPLSSLVAVPVFAFFAAGVTVGGLPGFAQSFAEPVTIGIIAALAIGKPLGILGVTYLATRLPGITLDPRLRWPDLAGITVHATSDSPSFYLSVSSLSGPAAATTPRKSRCPHRIPHCRNIRCAVLAIRNRQFRKA